MRSIAVNDSDPGLDITQNGSGRGLNVTSATSEYVAAFWSDGSKVLQMKGGNPAKFYGPGNGWQLNVCVLLIGQDANREALAVRGASSQVSDLLQLQNSGGTALFKVESDGDINSLSAGGHKQGFGFMQQNVAASQSAVQIDVLGLAGNMEIVMPFAGSVLGIGVASNAARTGGTLTVDVTIDGTATGLQATLDGTNTQYHSATQAKDADAFSAGDRLGVKITTDADWTPSAADVVVTVIVEM